MNSASDGVRTEAAIKGSADTRVIRGLSAASKPRTSVRSDLGEVACAGLRRSRRTFPTAGTSSRSAGGDAHRLAQLLVNLLSNAARYTPPGGRILLKLSRHEGYAVVS